MKESTTNKALCLGLPPQFLHYMNYVTGLEFEEAPDYEYMKELILEAAEDAGYDLFDSVYDWSIKLTTNKDQEAPCEDQS